MKKMLLLIFSLLITTSSFGEWSYITKGGDDEYYIDFDTISNNNGYVYYWRLMNFPSPPYGEGVSQVELFEVNCNPPVKERRKMFYFFNSPMGNGQMGPVNDASSYTGAWGYARPGSVRKRLLEAVC